MNRFNYSIFIVCIIVFCSCQKKEVTSEIWTPSKVVEVGEFQISNGISDSILLINKGNEKVRIKGYQSDCACTIPELDTDEINPSDSIYMKFELHPSLPGFVQQKIMIETNSNLSPKILFLIRGRATL